MDDSKNRKNRVLSRLASLKKFSYDEQEKAKIPNPIKSNNDYHGCFVERLRERNQKRQKRKRTKEKIASLTRKGQESKVDSVALDIGIDPDFLKAVLELTEQDLDFYFPFTFKQNPKAIKAANDLDFITFVEYYFGEHYLSEGMPERLEQLYNKNKQGK